jgi:hypothetical protein
MKKIWLLLLCSILSLTCTQLVFGRQFSVSGTVYDAETNHPLAFVNIVTNEKNTGAATDIDGRFQLFSDEKIEFLRLSYVGYEPKIFPIGDQSQNLIIPLNRLPVELQEVIIIAGENPAHRIIRNVIDNRERNDHENLRSFSYTSYDKMLFTVDTLELETDQLAEPDSSGIRLRDHLKDKDLFLMETISERKFMAPNRNHEKVIATRISGLKDPVILFLTSHIQTTTIYKELIRIGDKNYISPIAGGSLRRYSFMLEDTTYTANNDSVFIISYRPKPNTNFDGLKGILSINTRSWAIQNVIAEPSREDNGISIKIQQMYEMIDDVHWFPVQLNTDVIFSNVMVNNNPPIGRGKSYIRDIELNPDLVRRQFNQIAIDVDPHAGDRDEHFWIEYRGDSLSERDRQTYFFMDSIGRKENLDRMANTFKSLINGRVPWGKMDIDLSQILKYNQHERLYLGIGLNTNRKFSERLDIGGFWGYGFGDKSAKYGGNFGISLNRYHDTKLRFGYYDHVTETGSVTFFDDKTNAFSAAGFYDLFINRMDQTRRIEASLNFRAMKWVNFNIGLANENKKPTNEYKFQLQGGNFGEQPLSDDFTFSELTAGFRFAFKERFLQTTTARISLGTDYPVVWFNYTRGLDNLLNGEFVYNKFDLKIESRYYFKLLGESKLNIRAGYVDKPIPYANLYNGRSAFKSFSIYAQDAFLTQRMNEFLSDRYIYLFYTHNFGRLLVRSKRFNPEFTVAANFGIGSLNNSELHQNVNFKTMEQIYSESGLMINRLLAFPPIYTIGAGVFYRYGYHHLPKLSDNFSYRLTVFFLF